jgi:NAD-dependent dihydropyrimidine dehydrogenase PreA subunit
MSSGLSPVIGIDDSKCKNCHKCIEACPVKYCIDGSGDKIRINHDRCIGCGRCIDACSHRARFPLDDSEAFFSDLKAGRPLVVIVAPAAAANFAGRLGRLVGFLRASGAVAVFDASFGAELCAASYRRHLEEKKPRALIAQPCPAIVSYIELYRPGLLPSLAPVDSPLLCSAKAIRAHHPEYARAKIAALTPCLAKKREFEETGEIAYNVTFLALAKRLESLGKSLDEFPEAGFDGPEAGRAAGFPLPGGLLRTLGRDAPGVAERTRTIEGPDHVYPYLDGLAASIGTGIAPLVVDCLNCDFGCIVGPGGRHRDLPLDLLRNMVDARRAELEGSSTSSSAQARKVRILRASVEEEGRGLDLRRRYLDRSASSRLSEPGEAELARIYADMGKKGEEDIYDCASCGYGSCRGMAIAIHNGLNRKENCHQYQRLLLREDGERARELSGELRDAIVEIEADMAALDRTMTGLLDRCTSQAATIEESSAAMESMIESIRNASRVSAGRKEDLSRISQGAKAGGESLAKASSSLAEIKGSVSGVGEVSSLISDIAERINLLSMNAAIEAAHAGAAGRGFAVISGEVKRLAEASSGNATRIGKELSAMESSISGASELSLSANEAVSGVMRELGETASGVGEVLDLLAGSASGSTQLIEALREMRESTVAMKEAYEEIASRLSEVTKAMGGIRSSSEAKLRDIVEAETA